MVDFVRREWLTKRTTVPAAIKRYPLLDEPALVGFWRQMQDGDELWYFKTPPITWEKRMGRMGVAIVRGGEIVTHASGGNMS